MLAYQQATTINQQKIVLHKHRPKIWPMFLLWIKFIEWILLVVQPSASQIDAIPGNLATCFSSLLHGALSAALEAEKSTATSLHNTVNAARILAQAKVDRRPGSGFVLQSRKVL